MGDTPLTVALVAPAVVRPLRHAVLRPGWPDEDSIYPGDDDALTAHAAVTEADGGSVIAVGSILPEPAPWAPDIPAWRIRGMATDDRYRSQGRGSLVLTALGDHVRRNGGGLVWCNARIKALPFYERAGFEGRDEVFELPGIGAHRRMWRTFEVWEPEGS